MKTLYGFTQCGGLKNVRFILAAMIVNIAYAASAPVSLAQGQQLMVVTSVAWSSSQAKLQRYQRNKAEQSWEPVGAAIDVVLGKNGITKKKKEGDLRTPAGVFSLGTVFGFAKNLNFSKMPYLPLMNSTVCVDDAKSAYYNQIIDSRQVVKNSWGSGEMMRTKTPQYTLGLMVNYNTPKRVAGAGSCIFMHVWSSRSAPTVGCIAMSQKNMQQILSWLDPRKRPAVAIRVNY